MIRYDSYVPARHITIEADQRPSAIFHSKAFCFDVLRDYHTVARSFVFWEKNSMGHCDILSIFVHCVSIDWLQCGWITGDGR